MFEVEVRRVTFEGRDRKVSVIDTYYFNGETEEEAFNKAKEFCNSFNATMPFHEDREGYDIAAKPRLTECFSTKEVILEALKEIGSMFSGLKRQPVKRTRNRSDSIHLLGDYLKDVIT